MADNAGWSLTESEPGIFSEMLWGFGTQGLQVEDLWTMDDSLMDELEPIHALIFLFKWVGGHDDTRDGEKVDVFPGYFAHQVINNACATLAVLNAVFNIPPSSSIKLGEELENLRAFSSEFDASTRGEVITNSEKIREVHNSFARSDPFAVEDDGSREGKEEPYHFIVYQPIDGTLYELDGLQQTPRSHGPVPSDRKWTSLARDVIERRINSYPPGELHFSLLALTSDRLAQHSDALARAREAGEEARVVDLEEKLEAEREKRRRWASENAIRRHNSIPLIHALLLGLAKSVGPERFGAILGEARDKGKERRERRERGKGGMEE